MKIYAITQGEYSDYRIRAITTNKDKAEKLRDIYTDRYEYDVGGTEAYIEEFEDGELNEQEIPL